jgi:hypothetical protein
VAAQYIKSFGSWEIFWVAVAPEGKFQLHLIMQVFHIGITILAIELLCNALYIPDQAV